MSCTVSAHFVCYKCKILQFKLMKHTYTYRIETVNICILSIFIILDPGLKFGFQFLFNSKTYFQNRKTPAVCSSSLGAPVKKKRVKVHTVDFTVEMIFYFILFSRFEISSSISHKIGYNRRYVCKIVNSFQNGWSYVGRCRVAIVWPSCGHRVTRWHPSCDRRSPSCTCRVTIV